MPGNEEWNNVLHFAGSSAVDADVDAVLDNLTDFYTALSGELTQGWHLDRFKVGEAGGPVVREDSVSGVDGTVTGHSLPNDCAFLVKWRTVHVGRSGAGKTFLSGAHTAHVELGSSSGAAIVGAAIAGTISAACSNLIGDPSNPLEVYSRVTGTGYAVVGGGVTFPG
jgi:hypothetical protein